MNKIHANIVSNQKCFEGFITFDHKIREIKKISNEENNKLPYLLPGFIDLHIHGGGGVDIMDDQSLSPLLKIHAQYGTTSLLLTTVTDEPKNLIKTFQKIAQHHKSNSINRDNEAHILGVHLEGPYINREKLGAQPAFTRNLSLDEIKKLHSLVPIKIITLAPELISDESLKKLIEEKFIIQIGHSNGHYDDGLRALKAGAKSFTHLYNAMSGLNHRSPGIVGAALAHGEYAEIIPDLAHVHPGAIKVALRSIPKIYFVTDATSCTGMPDGQYQLGTHTVTKCQNGVRLSDGTLAGSSLTLYDAFKNLIGSKLQLSIAEASYRLSTIQSELLGIEKERGSIDIDKYSDLILINRDFSIENVYLEGRKI